MGEVTATQVRRDAVQRLLDLADDDRTSIELALGRSETREIIRRRVLRSRHGDIAALHELERIWPLCKGEKEALIDAVHAGGLDPDAPPIPTVADLEQALAGWAQP